MIHDPNYFLHQFGGRKSGGQECPLVFRIPALPPIGEVRGSGICKMEIKVRLNE